MCTFAPRNIELKLGYQHIVGVILLFSLTVVVPSWGQGQRDKSLYHNRLDTLSFYERINMRTNFVDWLTLIPNIGVEFNLGKMNWNRWTLGMNLRWKPSTRSSEIPILNVVYDIRNFGMEVRRYHHGRGFRRSYFIGGYGAYGKHDVRFGVTGYKGNHIAVGLTAGMIMPLYSYRNNSSLDLELALALGPVLCKQDEYEKDENGTRVISTSDNYSVKFNPPLLLAANDALRVSLVYHFGPSVANRYKKRIAIDERYRVHLSDMEMRRDSIHQAHVIHKAVKRDSLEKADYERRFEKQRLELEQQFLKDSLRQVKILSDEKKQKKGRDDE